MNGDGKVGFPDNNIGPECIHHLLAQNKGSRFLNLKHQSLRRLSGEGHDGTFMAQNQLGSVQLKIAEAVYVAVWVHLSLRRYKIFRFVCVALSNAMPVRGFRPRVTLTLRLVSQKFAIPWIPKKPMALAAFERRLVSWLGNAVNQFLKLPGTVTITSKVVRNCSAQTQAR
jgi:hypothetical protein